MDMEKVHQITTREIGWEKIEEILDNRQKIVLSEEAVNRISTCRNYLDKRLEKGDEVLYGINTGFGSLCDTVINREDLGYYRKTWSCPMHAE